jgi:hypothetical protein
MLAVLEYPSVVPTFHPSSGPTEIPTFVPSHEPTAAPSEIPTSMMPTYSPTVSPTPNPTIVPTTLSQSLLSVNDQSAGLNTSQEGALIGFLVGFGILVGGYFGYRFYRSRRYAKNSGGRDQNHIDKIFRSPLLA